MAHVRIAIIGGGISGLCSAVALQKKGIHTEVYEKAKEISGPDTGIVLSGNAIRAFYIMGLGRQMLTNGVTTNHCYVKSHSGEVIAKFDYHSPTHIPNYLFMKRSTLMNILAEALLPGSLHMNKELIDFEQNAHTIKLNFKDGCTAEAEYLIGSDGTDSPIRKKLIPDSHLTLTGSVCWRGFIDNPSFNEIPYTETWGPRGRFGITPMPGNRLYWYAFKKSASSPTHMLNWTSMDLLFNFFYYHDPIQQILENTPSENIIFDELSVIQPLEHFYYGNILLVGDSAHASMPNIGQGASLAIEEAAYLSKWISTEDSIDKAFEKYELNRMARMKLVKNETKIYELAAKVDFPILCSIRNKLLQLAPAGYHNEKLRKVVEISDEI
ncbi:FAD-dependent monooxygenase [Heyndrickxia sp. MSNUG]|uniref:FAD-dependent monooxygenase n=1 Tax=Heyndrickxia sp. MSNUG TaxID=3136677 RepID=UPI003C2D68C9